MITDVRNGSLFINEFNIEVLLGCYDKATGDQHPWLEEDYFKRKSSSETSKTTLQGTQHRHRQYKNL